ncbi:hypothetical protein ACWDUK_32990 [Streptomyces cellulosae]
MVILFEGEYGEQHATSPGAVGSSGGFALSNGQVDEYPDDETVPLEAALRIVSHLLREGSWPADAQWAADRY